jgi:hypothetical protein
VTPSSGRDINPWIARPNKTMHRQIILLLLASILLSACSLSPQSQATLTATQQTATAAMWTETPSLTATFTVTDTPTETATSTQTLTPTITPTPTIIPTPTFDFPKVTVNVALAACLYGPAKGYLWKFDLKQGDSGYVGGRAPVGAWLYVKFDRLTDFCWVSPFVVDLVGDVNTLRVQQVLLPITNALYAAPKNVTAERDGDQVTVSWSAVWMTLDDDNGYFLDVWVCQNKNYVWMPVGWQSLPDQYHTSYTFTDQAGCSQTSGGKLYTVEKHGYTTPVDIPWPPVK